MTLFTINTAHHTGSILDIIGQSMKIPDMWPSDGVDGDET